MMILDPALQALFRPRLLPAERLLWAGRPRRGLLFAPADLYLIPFSLLWGGFAIFWNATVWMADPPGGIDILFKLWGLPFLALGLYMIAGRFFHSAWLRAHTFYAVTDSRLLFLRTGPFGRFKSIELGYLPMFELEELRGGRGTLVFDDEVGGGHWSGHFVRRGHRSFIPETGGDRFYAVERPREVYDLIRREVERRRDARGGSNPLYPAP